MVNFYRRFLPAAANAQVPLTELLGGPKKNDVKIIEKNEALLTAFHSVKQTLGNTALLAHSHPTASLGAVLQQETNGNWQPL